MRPSYFIKYSLNLSASKSVQPTFHILFSRFWFLKYSVSRKNRVCMEVRLNSPCGKFKITNIGDDQVDLAPEDIPGTSFIEE